MFAFVYFVSRCDFNLQRIFCLTKQSYFFWYFKTADLIVELPQGQIRGHVLQSEDGKPYCAFQEIPYAAPPIGSNRFQVRMYSSIGLV